MIDTILLAEYEQHIRTGFLLYVFCNEVFLLLLDTHTREALGKKIYMLMLKWVDRRNYGQP